MKIETKYDIGQEVWFCHNGKPYKGIVENISISAMSWEDGISVNLNYLVFQKVNSPFSKYIDERSLFPTKEELLKCL